jgi:hypothetical protein
MDTKPETGIYTRSILTAFMLLLLYVLSIGPAAKLYFAWRPAQPAIETIYGPILATCGPWKPLDTALNWYIWTLWRPQV